MIIGNYEIGNYEIKWETNCYVVGIPNDRVRKNGTIEHKILKPKYYVRLEDALASLPGRMTSDIFNTCGDIKELRLKIRAVADGLLKPLSEASLEAAQSSESA